MNNTEHITSITQIKGAKYDVARALPEFLTILKFLHYREKFASTVVKVGG